MHDIEQLTRDLIARQRLTNARYRIQFNPSFTFRAGTAIVEYLHHLGISEAYASPLFTARLGSTHGYDVCDYRQLSPALGGDAQFAHFSAALQKHGMGLILDMVPNHMGIGNGNAWWMDVLEHGPASPYAAFFDIDWEPVKQQLAGKVLLPILGDQYGVVLENGELQLAFDESTFVVRYYDTWLPLAPRSTQQIFEVMHEHIVDKLPEEDDQRQELESIITALNYLPPRDETDPERLAERRRESAVIKRRFATLYEANAETRAATEASLKRFNGTVDDPRSFDLLDNLLQAQPYRLAYWRVAAEEINYRRFFDINDLAAVRVELPEVFERTHELVFRLLSSGVATGLRIDHPDGLWDPPAYFRQLQERYLLEILRARGDTPDEEIATGVRTWVLHHSERRAAGEGRWPLAVVAEKILSESEPLPPEWAVDGTTGYDFLNLANGIFVDAAQEQALDSIYRRFVRPENPSGLPTFAELAHQAKEEIMNGALASEITSFSHQLERINEKNRRYRDFTLRGLTQALTAIIAELSIYRTYITDPDTVSERDLRFVLEAVRAARRLNPDTPRALISFLRDTMLLRNLHEFRPEDRHDVIDVVMRLQQITGPVMAKSVEDTAFYRYHRLISLNEVGGHPEQFGLPLSAFHFQNAERQRIWPHAMLATSTHDTKRSEDVRARLNVLSELPEEWETLVVRWAAAHARLKRDGRAQELEGRGQEADGRRPGESTAGENERWPDRATEYLLYQTLIGAWPLGRRVTSEVTQGAKETVKHVSGAHAAGERAGNTRHAPPLDQEMLAGFRERITAYMQKATREAKLYTSWLNPVEAYDSALSDFVAAVLDPTNPVLTEIAAFAQRISFFGQLNSLAQTMLKLTVPGVPDIYQGTELWDLSLVDPDNRRPVDYDLRRRYLADLDRRSAKEQDALVRDLIEHHDDGRIKLYLISRLLRYRREHPALFAEGKYLALEASGSHHQHVVAFARTLDTQHLVVVVPRLMVGLCGGKERMPLGETIWRDTHLGLPDALGGARLSNVLTSESIEVTAGTLALADVFARLPVAVLVHEG